MARSSAPPLLDRVLGLDLLLRFLGENGLIRPARMRIRQGSGSRAGRPGIEAFFILGNIIIGIDIEYLRTGLFEEI
jgi:hypothetical protein